MSDSALRHLTIIGDSHASFLVGREPKEILKSQQGDLVLWLGPRLMYSVAHRGFEFTWRQTWALRRLNFSTLVFVLGEIDVRMYLGQEPHERFRNPLWVKRYCEKICELKSRYRAKRAIIVSPVPPSDLGYDNPRFPRVGTLQARVNGLEWLRAELERNSRGFDAHGVALVDPTVELVDESGQLNAVYTDDGVHLNESGARIVLDRVRTEAHCQ